MKQFYVFLFSILFLGCTGQHEDLIVEFDEFVPQSTFISKEDAIACVTEFLCEEQNNTKGEVRVINEIYARRGFVETKSLRGESPLFF